MDQNRYLLILAITLMALLPLVPKMVALRIRFLRWLKWNRIADWHERHTQVLVPVVRTIFVVIALMLVISIW